MDAKRYIKKLMPSFLLKYKSGLARSKWVHKNETNKTIFLKTRVFPYNTKVDNLLDYSSQFLKICRKCTIDTDGFYVYPYNSWYIRLVPEGKGVITSYTMDYSIVLKSSIKDLIQKIQGVKNEVFRTSESNIVDGINILSNRIKKSLENNSCDRNVVLSKYFDHLMDGSPNSLDEALQKILFYNALTWQMNHRHNGLGRLDYILFPYYEKDINSNTISKNQAKELLKHFVLTLAKDTAYKSHLLLGDTGQYILIGGIDENGKNVDNELTELFLDIFNEVHIPDPKLILRVNKNTNHTIWSKSIELISKGTGSPLIMNEGLIVRAMEKFGYAKDDLWNVGTSACWEPLIIGKSFDQNNPLPNIPVIQALNDTLYSNIEYKSFDSLLHELEINIRKQINLSVKDVDFDVSPYFSLFIDTCFEKETDISLGGAKYSYHGIQIVSLPNLVNALLNIKKYVFDESFFTLDDCAKAIKNNFKGQDDLLLMLRSNNEKFGLCNDNVLMITNLLLNIICDETKNQTINGNRIKVGFSSSQYISKGKETKATLDGRKDADPFAVHISPISHNISIEDVLDFAGKLKYDDNNMNGNVVDFIVPSSYLKNKDKFISILEYSMTHGVFELQLNVLDKRTLIDAKAHPEKYPNLVVRVWGFSAYFNDLPEDYKDNLIRRAEIYETA